MKLTNNPMVKRIDSMTKQGATMRLRENARGAFAAVVAATLFAATASVARAELPPAPSVSTPPILSEAKLWLDAWDYDTFQKDENGYVTNWLSKADSRYNASNYVGAVLGTVGVTNGVPAYLMGDAGSGIDLMFTRMTKIRTVFWVMDVVSATDSYGDKACFLADSQNAESFKRYGDCVFYWGTSAFAGRFWLGDEQLFTWDARRFCLRDKNSKFVGLQVYALSCDSNLTADRLSVPKGGGVDKSSGGRALSELIIFDRTLSNEEVLQVKSYLNAKWKGVAAATVSAATTPTAVTGYDDLTLGENASFVLTDAVLGGSKAAPVSVWGTLDKSAAGKIRITYAGNVWNRTQSLFCVGSGGLSLADFELTGIPEGCTVWCDGRDLWMNVQGADEVSPSPVLADRTATGPRLWLDASKADSFVTNSTGGVLQWKDQSAYGNDATNYAFNSQWTYPTVGETNGVPALLMGKPSSNMDLAFNFMDDVRTVFWVMDIQADKYASFLGTYTNGWTKWTSTTDNYIESRQQAYQRSMNGRTRNDGSYVGFFMFTAPDQVYGGTMLEDGVVPSGTALTGDTELRWIGPHLGRHVFSHTVSNDIPAWANNLGRCGNSTTYSGGKAISELIVFNRTLSDAERTDVESELMVKWRLASATVIGKSETISSPVTYSALTMDRESVGHQSQTEAAIVLAAGSVTPDVPAIKVYGEFRRGDISKLRFSWAGGEVSPGTYTILECANFFNCGYGDFEFAGFPEESVLYMDGTSIKMTILDEFEPLVPSALSAAGDAAPWIWLDASAASTFTTNAQGGVTAWADRGARGNDATAYLIGEAQQYGAVGVTNGVPAFLMGEVGSGIDLAFSQTTSALTMFWVMDIVLNSKADFLGDDSALNFQRGGTGQYCNHNAAQSGFRYGTILEDGGTPHDKISNPSYGNHQLKPYPSGSTHIYSLQAGQAMSASSLSARKKSSTSDTANCNGGRALSELVVFNRALTAKEMGDIETYLELKWYNSKVTLTETVDATAGVSYPNLLLGSGAGFAVNPFGLKEGGDAAVTVYGVLSQIESEKIVIRNGGERMRKGVTLLKCAVSVGVSLDSFDFVGFPDGTKFGWTGTELKIVDCPQNGLIMVVR